MATATAELPLVLAIEDEAPMRKFLRNFLSPAGFRFEEAGSGQQGLALAAESPPQVILLDLGLPDMDGQDVLRKLRQWSKAPIIVLSVRDQDAQKIMALNYGADDYLTKPFSPGELLARIRVAMRHAASGTNGGDVPVFESGDLKVDLLARRVFVRGAEVRLTPHEFKLLTVMVQHADRVLTHQYLLQEVWGAKQAKNKQHLRVFMAGLRHKIEADAAQPRHLVTEQGVGYRLVSGN
jgi:two-component system KDP operon response regulator KdpE